MIRILRVEEDKDTNRMNKEKEVKEVFENEKDEKEDSTMIEVRMEGKKSFFF